MFRKSRNGSGLLKDLAYGAIGGGVGTVVMGQVTSFMYRFESAEKKRREELARPEEPPQAMVRRLAEDVLHVNLSDEKKKKLGEAMHWAYGMAWGALYGALHDRAPALSKAAGLPFGLGFWFVGDEVVTTAFKLTGPPRAFPIDAHLRGLVGHLAYTAAADGTYRALRRVAG
jgi:uncharacterized membrane protein YagU involved in acid resistance